MKTKFAKEKSEYSHLIWENIENFSLSGKERMDNLARMKQIEQYFKSQNDEIMVIVTTRETNPIDHLVASPMSMEDISAIH